jgi:hypothetical protein
MNKTVIPLNGEIYYYPTDLVDYSDLRKWELRYPKRGWFWISSQDKVHSHRACAGQWTSMKVNWTVVQTLWEHGQTKSQEGSFRLISWCEICCVKEKR